MPHCGFSSFLYKYNHDVSILCPCLLESSAFVSRGAISVNAFHGVTFTKESRGRRPSARDKSTSLRGVPFFMFILLVTSDHAILIISVKERATTKWKVFGNNDTGTRVVPAVQDRHQVSSWASDFNETTTSRLAMYIANHTNERIHNWRM